MLHHLCQEWDQHPFLPQSVRAATGACGAEHSPSHLSQTESSTQQQHPVPFTLRSRSQRSTGVWLRGQALWRDILAACGSHSFRATICPQSHRCLFCPQDYVDAPLSIPEFLTCSLNIDWSQYQVRGPSRAGQSKERCQGACGASPSCRYMEGAGALSPCTAQGRRSCSPVTLPPALLLAQKI